MHVLIMLPMQFCIYIRTCGKLVKLFIMYATVSTNLYHCYFFSMGYGVIRVHKENEYVQGSVSIHHICKVVNVAQANQTCYKPAHSRYVLALHIL